MLNKPLMAHGGGGEEDSGGSEENDHATERPTGGCAVMCVIEPFKW